MVAGGGDAALAEVVADLLDGAAAHAVDDAAALRPVGDEARERLVLGAPARGPLDRKREVGPVEARHDAQGVLEAKGALDVLAHLAGGGCGERHDGAAGLELVDELANALVAGTKVVAPLRDAVGLVDGEQAGRLLVRQVEKGGVVEALGRHIEQRELARPRLVENLEAVGRGERAVEAGRGDAQLTQGADLVAHERDEGRHHDGEAAEGQGGHLVADRLACRGGHDGHDVLPGKGGVDDLLLVRAKAWVAKTRRRMSRGDSLVMSASPPGRRHARHPLSAARAVALPVVPGRSAGRAPAHAPRPRAPRRGGTRRLR